MVAVTSLPPQKNPQAWLDKLSDGFAAQERAAIVRAWQWVLGVYGTALTPDADPYVERAQGAATILSELKLDHESIIAALLLGVPAVLNDAEVQIEQLFGAEIATMVQGVSRMGQMQEMQAMQAAQAHFVDQNERQQQTESLRKMLLAMVQDARVVLVKLAERTQALRFLMKGDVQRRQEAAQSALTIFAPLANRLGVGQIKWELEDLSMRALEPETYQQLAAALDERRADRERYIEQAMTSLSDELSKAGIKAEVSGRPKHIYSIYRKMQRKATDLNKVYDIRALRVLVNEVKDCYAALSVVHNLWTPIAEEFDDYIVKPKANNYRSLHTAVIDPENNPLEVQIRTYQMHQHAEYGVAAHWRYKESAELKTKRDVEFDEKLGWLRQILEWGNEVAETGKLLREFKESLLQESIYVLTPQGKIVDLPKGATPVDFAYTVHTSLGHRCRGAKVDGVMQPLNTPLKTGQRIEITAVKQGGPSRDWLNPELGFVVSHRAKSKVRQWFKQQQIEQTIAQGRTIVEAELKREGATAVNLDDCASRAGFSKLDTFFIAAANGEISLRDIQTAIRTTRKTEAKPEPTTAQIFEQRIGKTEQAGKGILIIGVGKLLTGLARCCKPVPPDVIIGFVTRGKGITIHRQACPNVQRIKSISAERLIAAEWGEAQDEVFPIDIEVIAIDRQGLLRDISDIFSREKINVAHVNTMTKNMQAKGLFTIEVKGTEQLRRVLSLIKDVAGVMEARRR